MKIPGFMSAAIVLALFQTVSASAAAQQLTLTLDEAYRIARQNNPALLQAESAMGTANAAVRSAYGAFLPSISASFGSSFQQGGRQVLSGAELGASSDVIQSSYSVGISERLSAITFLNPRIQKANRSALESDIAAGATGLRFAVATRYISVLQAEARAALQDSLLASARVQLELARVRASIGSGIALDVQRAEISLGQVEVARIRERNSIEIEKLALWRELGILLPDATQLTTTFPLTEPVISRDTLLAIARRENPDLQAIERRQEVARLFAKRARAEYLPSLNIGTGLGGYTYQYRDADFLIQRQRAAVENQREDCFSTDSLRVGAGMPSIAQQCQLIQLTPAQEAGIRSANSQYPFDFTRSPRSISLSLSLPIFDGLAREQRVTEAEVSHDNAILATRARELALTVDVTSAHLTLLASHRAAALQEQNAEKARLELQMVMERYRVGSANFVEVSDSRALFERAMLDRINAIYEFHKAFAALESVVGRPLR